MLSAPRTFAQAARVGRIARQGRTIDAMVSDPERTGVVAVARPEEMPVNETLALQHVLRDDIGLHVDLIVCNGMLPSASPPPTRARSRRPPTARRSALRATPHARAQAQRAQLRRLRRGARAPVATLLFAFEDGAPRLARLARELERWL